MDLVFRFQRWLNGDPSISIEFDHAYLDHLNRAHGGRPGKCCFRTSDNRERMIDTFLNFVDHHQDEIHGANSVSVCWSGIEDRLGPFFIPFALLFAGDYLCFDYSSTGRPTVIVWLHEESTESHPPTAVVIEFEGDPRRQMLPRLGS